MAKACGTMGDRRGGYRGLVGGPVGKRSLGRTRLGWKDNNKMNLHEGHWGRGMG
jgi:hypothetical protein